MLVNHETNFVNMIEVLKYFPHRTQDYVSAKKIEIMEINYVISKVGKTNGLAIMYYKHDINSNTRV